MRSPNPRQTDLPAFYYHDHFQEMLAFGAQTYGHILSHAHREFIDLFNALPMNARCLFIRLVNRRGAVFRLRSLQYQEIPDLTAALDILNKNGFAGPLTATNHRAALIAMTKDELIVLARQHAIDGFKSSWSKAKIVQAVHASVPFESIANSNDSFVVQHRQDEVEFLLFLFFGKTHRNLVSFALRDLGIVLVSNRSDYKARFEDASEANDCFYYSRALAGVENLPDDELDEIAAIMRERGAPASAFAASLRAQCAFAIGRRYEKLKQPQAAIDTYRLESSAEGDERIVRLHYAMGNKDAARDLLIAMVDDPASDDEYIFASDFLARKFERQRVSAVTALLRDAKTIWIDDAHRTQPEEGVAAYFRRDGWAVHHTENALWQCLFGLVFWDELFGLNSDLHSGFDRVPSCLKDNSFHVRYAKQISAKLTRVEEGCALEIILRSIAGANRQPNGVFAWYQVDIEAIRDLIEKSNPTSVARILRSLASDYNGLSEGFPDLMLTKQNFVHFYEVKAEGDVIRRNQMARLRLLRDVGLSADILRVSYRYDPEQIYVVVDIETTGGRANSERITEIGAVKVRDGVVIDEWHRLVHPQRRIPSFITSLTGITDEMVADAPVFADIADGFTEFMRDAIFVAHNVNFDYGFISEEYRRVGQNFRHPKFCTCAEMRRHFAGQKSYSLGALCKAMNIELVNHHRALADAKAASGLLKLINERRLTGQNAAVF